MLDAAPPGTAYIECAQACGLALLGGPPTVQTALTAHSRGVGQLIAAALDAGAGRIVVGLGGSSCTDGGRAMVDALGGLDSRRASCWPASNSSPPPTSNTHCWGRWGPRRYSARRRERTPKPSSSSSSGSPTGPPNSTRRRAATSAANPARARPEGIGAALLALGGRRESGAAVIAEHTRLADDVAAADLVITGEGRFDDQSLHGKVVSALAGAARARHIPVLVLAGQVTLDDPALRVAGITAAYSIADHAGSVQLAIDDAANQLAGLASANGPTGGAGDERLGVIGNSGENKVPLIRLAPQR